MTGDDYTLSVIRAELRAAEQGYPVHIGCGGEVVAIVPMDTGTTSGTCQRCGTLASAVAMPDHLARKAALSIRHLLDLLPPSRGNAAAVDQLLSAALGYAATVEDER